MLNQTPITLNQYHILNTIRIAGAISRIEIAEILGYSRAAVTNITAKLIENGVVYEKEASNATTRGRNRIMLAINGEAAFVAGIKLSAFRISCVVTNALAEIKSQVTMPVRTSERPVEFIADLIEEAVRHCVKEAGLTMKQIAGIGIGIPGLINTQSGQADWSPLYSHSGGSLKKLLRQKLNIMTVVDNDTNTVALSQLWTGKGKGLDNFLAVTIEDGMGMGIVVDGELYRGSQGYAGEIGHVVANPEGDPCRCGKQGCYETYISNFGILNSVRRMCASGKWHCQNPEELTYEDILSKAQAGDQQLVETFTRAGRYLGLAVSALHQLLNPTKIIITGNGTRAGDLLFPSMYETLKMTSCPNHALTEKVLIHEWQDIDWSLGAACLVLQTLYKSPLDRVSVAQKLHKALGA